MRESANEQLESTTYQNSTELTSDKNNPPEDRRQPSDEEPEDLQRCVVPTGCVGMEWGWEYAYNHCNIIVILRCMHFCISNMIEQSSVNLCT